MFTFSEERSFFVNNVTYTFHGAEQSFTQTGTHRIYFVIQ